MNTYIEYADPVETGKEYYYFGQKYLKEYKYKEAADAFMKALDLNYDEAGNELFQLALHYPQCTISVEELAEHLIPEANYYVAEHAGASSDEKYIVNLKMAAAQYHFSSIEKIANILYGKYENKDAVTNKDDIRAVHNIIALYSYLNSKKTSEQYKLKMGRLYCKINFYSEAHALLKNLRYVSAYYECGRMYEEGKGTSVNLEKAKSLYEKAGNFKDASERYEKICDILYRKEEEKRESGYNSNTNYSSSYSGNYGGYDDDGCFTAKTRICMADHSVKNAEDIVVGDEVLVFDHYKGELTAAPIIANVHHTMKEVSCPIITLHFECGRTLELAVSHILFDVSESKYVWIDFETVGNYVGHSFAVIENGSVHSEVLETFAIKTEIVKYYAPVSKYHLNVVAEGVLTMPPVPIILKIFDIKKEMKYDIPDLDRSELTSYEEIKEYVTKEEYNNLPCRYLDFVLKNNSSLNMKDFIEAIQLFHE